MFNKKDIKYLVLSIIFLSASVGFVRTTLSIMRNSARLDNLREEVVELQKQKAYISENLAYQKSPEYIEQEARNKLNMIKPNEYLYVDEDLSSNNREVLGENVKNIDEPSKELPSNFNLWIQLLF